MLEKPSTNQFGLGGGGGRESTATVVFLEV